MFHKIPASKTSIAGRKLLHGVGVNDADYVVRPTVNGLKSICPIYSRWASMLARCYCKKSLIDNPSYAGCSVCEEWLLFSSFSKWCVINYVDGYHLDKDIRIKGNKVYSPEACMFVTAKKNTEQASAKRYKFKSPNGDIINVFNLRQFCRDNGLCASTMCKVNKGQNSHHHGWTAVD